MLFLKDPDPAGSAYLVLRDTTRGGEPTAWQFWTLSEQIVVPGTTGSEKVDEEGLPGASVLPARELPQGDRYTARGQFGVDAEYFIAALT